MDCSRCKVAALLLIGLSFLLSGCIKDEQPNSGYLYLGQKPPGEVPEVFAPGVISGVYRLHGYPAFSPDGKEIYWPVLPPKILFTKYENGTWSEAAEASFSGGNSQAPVFSPDGNALYYQAFLDGGYGSLDIWYVERSDTGWSGPMNPGQPVNTSKLESQPSFTTSGAIYFTGELQGVALNRGLYKAKFENGSYSKPQLLGDNINTEFIEIYPFIAPDESYLLFCSSRPSLEEENNRIYLAFRSETGKWSEPINLSQAINFDRQSAFPVVSPDGKYLFFISNNQMYWVSSKIIDQLRPE